MISVFGLRVKKQLGATYAPALFTFMFCLLVAGILPYGRMYLRSLRFVLYLRYRFWLRTFLYVIRRRRFVTVVFHREHGLFMAWFLLPIEILGIFMRPISLAVRLFANIMFGHYVIHYAFVFMSKPWMLPFFIVLVGPFICFELAVYVVQAYIFTFLIVLYLGE